MTGNLSDAAIGISLTAEEKEGEGAGPGAHQGAGPGAERDQNLTLVRKEPIQGDHLGRARIAMIEEKRRGPDGKQKPWLKNHQQMHQHLPQQVQVEQTITQGAKMHHSQRQ